MTFTCAELETARPRVLATVADIMRGRYVPGGSVEAWLRPLPVLVICACLVAGPEPARELLFAAVGRYRGASAREVAPGEFNPTNLAQSPAADAALMGWAALVLARTELLVGDAAACRREVLALTRRLPDWPPLVARRVDPQAEALFERASALLADEVA